MNTLILIAIVFLLSLAGISIFMLVNKPKKVGGLKTCNSISNNIFDKKEDLMALDCIKNNQCITKWRSGAALSFITGNPLSSDQTKELCDCLSEGECAGDDAELIRKWVDCGCNNIENLFSI